MANSENIIIFITTKDNAEAETISRKLLDLKLIACANIIPGIQSLFRWEGKVDRAQEVLLVIKTKRAAFREIINRVKSLHSYEVPEIIALPIVDGNQDYLNWINESVG